MVKDTLSWKEKALKTHGVKYDYSKVEYIHSKKPVIIICNLHGEFYQKPADHLAGCGCRKCGKSFNNEIFLEKAKKIHGDKYIYNKSFYTKMKEDIVITCKIHGDFITKPSIHLKGFNCPRCKQISITDFVYRANNIHNNKYLYDIVNYKIIKDKVRIICTEHGEFIQRASTHLEGQGCPKCVRELNLHRKSDWLKKYKGKETCFYILKCWNSDELFYKIGITGNIKLRYDSKSKLPYLFKVMEEIKSKDNLYIWELEKKVLRKNAHNNYIPKIKFGGSKYECFSFYPLK